MHYIFLLVWVYAKHLLSSFVLIPGTFSYQPDAVITIYISVNQLVLIHFMFSVPHEFSNISQNNPAHQSEYILQWLWNLKNV